MTFLQLNGRSEPARALCVRSAKTSHHRTQSPFQARTVPVQPRADDVLGDHVRELVRKAAQQRAAAALGQLAQSAQEEAQVAVEERQLRAIVAVEQAVERAVPAGSASLAVSADQIEN